MRRADHGVLRAGAHAHWIGTTNGSGERMRSDSSALALADDHDLLVAAGWPVERVRAELSDVQLEEMIDVYLARSDDAVAGALAGILQEQR